MIPKISVQGDRKYRVEAGFSVTWKLDYRTHWLWISEGTMSDGGSVPWFARPLIPGDWTLGIIPVIVHDFLYGRKGRLWPHEYAIEYQAGVWGDPLDRGDGTRTVWSRHEVDRLFGRMMREAGVSRTRRRAAYRAVRLARWHDWSTEPFDDLEDMVGV